MNNFFKAKKAMEEICTNELYNGICVPTRFRNVVLKHLILNYSGNINSFSPPLLLAIQGVKGEGKSFMIEKICEHYSIEYIPISGAELCGNLEGDSVKKLIYEYETACVRAASEEKMSCIVIDDFHKSLAASKQNNLSRTTNSETLIGRIMNLSDNPYVQGVRIPIILTGNNFTSVYSALTRHGRMEIFDWEPTIDEKVEIVFNIFKRYYPNIDFTAIECLVNKYGDNYIAFFKSLAQDIYWGDCDTIINAFHNNRKQISLANITEFVVSNLSVNTDISLSRILEYAEIRNNKTPKDFE